MMAMQIIIRQTGISRYTDCFPTGSDPPDKNAQIGRIIVKSMMFAPIILPIDKSDCFFMIAVTVVTSSGKEVPTAIIVTPIIASETPIRCAMIVPSSTRRSAPITIPAAPTRNFTAFAATSPLKPTAVESNSPVLDKSLIRLFKSTKFEKFLLKGKT